MFHSRREVYFRVVYLHASLQLAPLFYHHQDIILLLNYFIMLEFMLLKVVQYLVDLTTSPKADLASVQVLKCRPPHLHHHLYLCYINMIYKYMQVFPASAPMGRPYVHFGIATRGPLTESCSNVLLWCCWIEIQAIFAGS